MYDDDDDDDYATVNGNDDDDNEAGTWRSKSLPSHFIKVFG